MTKQLCKICLLPLSAIWWEIRRIELVSVHSLSTYLSPGHPTMLWEMDPAPHRGHLMTSYQESGKVEKPWARYMILVFRMTLSNSSKCFDLLTIGCSIFVLQVLHRDQEITLGTQNHSASTTMGMSSIISIYRRYARLITTFQLLVLKFI